MRSVSLPSIVTFLKAQPTVAAIFGTRVYVGEPVSDTQAGMYLVLNAITQTRNEVDCSARVEFRYLAHNEQVTKQALVDAQDATSRVIATGGPLKMGQFTVTHVDEGSDFLAARDDKNRNVLVRDYAFRFIWSN
jgi:putative AlgH/UPF0301 family transcriptional regulator